MAFVYDLILDAGRKLKVHRNNSILPCNLIFRDFRIMIPVSVNSYIIIKRMVRQDKSESLKSLIFLLVCRQETHIQIGSFHRHPVRLCGIEFIQSFRDVFGLVRILKTRAQDYPFMGKITSIVIIDSMH